jgi:dipeptidyl aminopeptidase/acylaminoacyl peptidase
MYHDCLAIINKLGLLIIIPVLCDDFSRCLPFPSPQFFSPQFLSMSTLQPNPQNPPKPHTAPYGAWSSPITADLIAGTAIGLAQPVVDGESVYWLELRPTEKGRSVVLQQNLRLGTIREITPASISVRSRVHEYGGAAYTVVAGQLYFVKDADQQVYCQPVVGDASATALTATVGCRYADGVVDLAHQRLIWVQEDHRLGDEQIINRLVSVPLQGGDLDGAESQVPEPQVLVSGADFYASPALSWGATHLAWLCWHHPQMPWDGTELWIAPIQAKGELGTPEKIAGGARESIYQPCWLPDGSLLFVSDRSDWWNLYRYYPRTGEVKAVCPQAAEFGWPQWVFGRPTYAPIIQADPTTGTATVEQLICAYNQANTWSLGRVDLATGQLQPLAIPDTDISDVQLVSPVSGTDAGTDSDPTVVYLGGSATQPTAVVSLNLTTGDRQILRQSATVSVDSGYLSQPQAIEFPSGGGLRGHAWYYPPQNRDYQGLPAERPPLLVFSHGGPTAASTSAFNLKIQFWTSRGFAVVDVNYGGSTGYGRPYRQRLQGQWGIVDVVDCVSAAQYLAAQGWVDPERLAIRGSSAGGYTTLAALTFHQVFKAGASYYGVSDLEILAKDTHKFEARYLDGLVGPYPESQALYQERSPLYAIDWLNCPVIFFQGLEDKVVPPNQAELMVTSLQQRGVPVAYLAFAGEQHGFRQAETIQRTLESELAFYAQIFGMPVSAALPAVEIHNWQGPHG